MAAPKGKDEKDKLFDEILLDIADGMPLNKALIGKLSSQTFYELLKDDEKSKRYTRATQDRADKIFEETLEIADDSSEDISTTEDGKIFENIKVIQRDRLRVETRKWFLAKLHPKKYGDKQEIDMKVSGEIKPIIEFGEDDE